MASLIIKNDVNPLGSVFLPMVVTYQWEFPNCTIYNASTALGIRVDVSFGSDIAVGDFVQVLNGSYKGTYRVTSLSSDVDYLYIVTDGVFASLDPLSNLFNIDVRQPFELWAGYASGAGSTVKPYQKIADISVAIDQQSGLFEIDLQSYLRSYFNIAPPVVGKDYNISLQYNLVYTQEAPTTQTINWVLAEQDTPFSDANVRIRVNGVDEVFQTSSSSGSLTVTSGDSIQVYVFGFSADYNQSLNNSTRLQIVDSDTVTLIDQTNAISSYTPTVVGEILFTFTVTRNKDYTVTASSFTS